MKDLIKSNDLKLKKYCKRMIGTQVCVGSCVCVFGGRGLVEGCQGLNLWSLQSIFMKMSTP